MPALNTDEYAALLAGACPGCGRRHLRVRAIVAATQRFLDGEPASPARFVTPPDAARDRIWAVDCADCKRELWRRDDCPGCGAKDRLAHALDGNHGLPVPAACPRCEHVEVEATAELRMHLDVVQGAVSRRVVDAEPHEGGYHVKELRCPSCEQTLGTVEQRCVVCGRSSLLRKLR